MTIVSDSHLSPGAPEAGRNWDAVLRHVDETADEKVLLLYQSANRDEDVFDEPNALRLDRWPNPHLAFGIGPHVCLGANLARLKVRVLFEELTRRFPEMSVSSGEAPTYNQHALVHSLKALPVDSTPTTDIPGW